MRSEMPLAALAVLLDLLESASLEVWLDGGWGVDALLHHQTRPHKDLDLVVRKADLPRLIGLLARQDFRMQPGGTPSSLVLANPHGLEVDIHVVELDAHGDGHYRMTNGETWIYPAAGFGGSGTIAGRRVKCLTPEVQVLGHATGYVPTEKDRRDMMLLAERYALELPHHLREPPGPPDPSPPVT